MNVVIRGSALWSGNFDFVRKEGHQEIPFTPLGGTADAPLFILTDNGTYRIYCNGKLFRTITIDGLVIPEQATTTINCSLKKGSDASYANSSSRRQTAARCLNYPLMVNENYPNLLIDLRLVSGEVVTSDRFSVTNAQILTSRFESAQTWAVITPIDETLPAVALIDDVIILVANYEQPPRRRR